MNQDTCNIDNGLIKKLREGNEQAFKELFDRYGVRLYQFSLRYLREKEDVEDLLHDVFLKIWMNRESLKTDTSFRAYLFTIAYNHIRQQFLKKSREERYIRIFAEEQLFDAVEEDRLDYVLLVQKMKEIIELLPPRRKEIFNLSYKEELKNHEIADKLGLSEQFIKNQLSLARKFITRKIKDDNCLSGFLLFCLFSGFKEKKAI